MIELTEIKELIPSSLYSWLNKEGHYDRPKQQALELIKNETGITIEDPRPDGMDWMLTPFAFLIEYLAGDALPGVSAEYEQRRQAKFEKAFVLLKAHKITTRVGAQAVFGQIDGLY